MFKKKENGSLIRKRLISGKSLLKQALLDQDIL